MLGPQGRPRLFSRSRAERGYFWEELDDFLGGVFGVDHGGRIAAGVIVVLMLGIIVVALR